VPAISSLKRRNTIPKTLIRIGQPLSNQSWQNWEMIRNVDGDLSGVDGLEATKAQCPKPNEFIRCGGRLCPILRVQSNGKNPAKKLQNWDHKSAFARLSPAKSAFARLLVGRRIFGNLSVAHRIQTRKIRFPNGSVSPPSVA
jgi:hypothetical protein